MKKFICLTFILTAILSFSANAQSVNSSGGLKNEVVAKAKTFMTQNPKATIEELKANLVDEYGIKDFKLVKDANGNYVKEQNLKNYEKKMTAEGLDTYTIIIILAVIGAIAVILLVFK